MSAAPLRLHLIGPGRVGRTLAHLGQAAGLWQVSGVAGRDPGRAAEAAQALGAPTWQAWPPQAPLAPADLWLLAVPDTQIQPVARQLAQALSAGAAGQALAPAMAWHCSGFLPAAELAPLQDLGWACASVHPALSFTDPASAAAQFAGTVCALEGDAPARNQAADLLGRLGARCFELQAADKPLYHAAAVFASNFLPVLQAVAQELWQRTGVPPAWVGPLAQGFVDRAASNLARLGPQAALTGPAARGDHAVLQAQGAALAATDASLGQAYAALSELAGRLAREGRCLG